MATFKEVSLSSRLYDDIAIKIRNSYPNACILYIYEIINPDLDSNYTNKKQELIELRGEINITEKLLFHGTSHKNINSIATNGFLTNKNKVSAFGRGSYFSTMASYSKNYSVSYTDDISYMFLCDVIVGKCGIYRNHAIINTEIHDNSVDSAHNPTIYVTPYDAGAYPRYLIAYHKNAK